MRLAVLVVSHLREEQDKEERKGGAERPRFRAQGRLPAFCAHRSVPATLAVGQDNRPISPGAPPHEVPPIVSS